MTVAGQRGPDMTANQVAAARRAQAREDAWDNPDRGESYTSTGRCFICGEKKVPVVKTAHRVPRGVTNARGPFTTRYVNKCAACAPSVFPRNLQRVDSLETGDDAMHPDLREAFHRYNVGPEWTRAEVLTLVQRLTKGPG